MKLFVILNIFLLVGCGSSGKIEDKQNIVILKNIPKGVCQSPEYQVALSAVGFNDYAVEEIDDDITCEDYGKSQAEGNCAIIPYFSPLTDLTNCVIAYTPSSNIDITKIPNGK